MSFASASCGAFVHGMEDEFSAVRQNTVRSICELSMSCQEFSEVAIPHLIDMLNDEIQSVRLLTISSLQKITQVSKAAHMPASVGYRSVPVQRERKKERDREGERKKERDREGERKRERERGFESKYCHRMLSCMRISWKQF